MSTDIGILLKDGLALAAFEGRKTVTRRPMADNPFITPFGAHGAAVTWTNGKSNICGGSTARTGQELGVAILAAQPAVIRGAGTAKVGGRVWIRECFSPVHAPPADGPEVLYRASADHALIIHMAEAGDRWRPSIHMPKWASRTWGRITSVTPCNLSTVDDAEAKREGFETADELKAALKAMYPDATWFWRVEWEPMAVGGEQ